MMVNDSINLILAAYGINADIVTKDFRNYDCIPKTHCGVYVITQQEKVIYVGKGFVRDRQRKHWTKAFALVSGNKDPAGWRWLRENVSIVPGSWTITYILLQKQTELSLMEGTLIHLLQPLANDETFKDNKRTLKE